MVSPNGHDRTVGIGPALAFYLFYLTPIGNVVYKAPKMIPWPIVILRDNGWEPCVLESSTVLAAPARDSTFEQRIQHYVSNHSYREIKERERTETDADGRKFRVVTMEHNTEAK
jgi:hypothetical protein